MKPKKVTIKTVLNGWRVSVGCQEVVFTEKEKLLAEISAYLDDPAEAEKKYQEAVNYKHFEYAKQGGTITYKFGAPISWTLQSAESSPTPLSPDTATPSEAGESS